MNMQVVDWNAHYKAVRSRITGGNPAPKVVCIPRPEPKRPPHELDATKYRSSIGPAWQEAPKPIKRDVLLIASNVKALTAARMGQQRREILAVVCERHNQPPAAILGNSRRKEVCLARFEFAYRLHEELGLSSAEIGRVLGRDHTSALHALNRFKAMLAAGEVTL